MAYQSVDNGDMSRSTRGKGAVDVVDEGAATAFDEIDGFSPSRRGRRGAALVLVVLAVSAVSAISAMRGRAPSQAVGTIPTSMASAPKVDVKNTPPKYSELSQEEVANLFHDFRIKFEKSYRDDAESKMRLEIFKRNLAIIDERNEGSERATHGVSMWTDMTEEEFNSLQTYGKISHEAKAYARAKSVPLEELATTSLCQACDRFPELVQYVDGDLPTSFDWRDYGAVTHVKNQAYCGSCWSFSTTGCLEGSWYVAGGDLIQLSEQQLVACDTEWNQGCNGGWPSLAMIYIRNNGGIVPEKIYAYRKVYMGDLPEPVCAAVVKEGNYASAVGNEISVSASTMDEDDIARWLILNGPLSVALDATGMEYYSSGIDMGEYCQNIELDHAVLIVGFGEEDGVKYWIIKNSWAIWWGERGYYRLVKGENACGIADEVTAILIDPAATS